MKVADVKIPILTGVVDVDIANLHRSLVFVLNNLSRTSFLFLSDCPESYSGNSGKILRVNSSETGIEFYPFLPYPVYISETNGTEYYNTTQEMTLCSTNIPANSYTYLLIEAEVKAEFCNTASSTSDFTWRVKVAGNTVKTFATRVVGSRHIYPIRLTVAGGQTQSTSVSITGQMSVADNGCKMMAHSFRIWGINA